jgi:ankyrin repeat protein
MLAAQEVHIEIVRALLAANADPRIAAHDGFTALDDAKRSNHTAIIALLEARLAEV